MIKIEEKESFNQHFVQWVIGLQSTAWINLGKVINPAAGKQTINLGLARDSIDALLMLKEKTKNNLTETEKGILENSMQDLELAYLDVSRQEENKQQDTKKEEVKNKEESEKEVEK
ncbi:MAG: DUF1844 domain-containing protein [Nanoarchaeota archaeon]|nr:DUF1844 domain-containing protein [Nanoarchaeota archaeon]